MQDYATESLMVIERHAQMDELELIAQLVHTVPNDPALRAYLARYPALADASTPEELVHRVDYLIEVNLSTEGLLSFLLNHKPGIADLEKDASALADRFSRLKNKDSVVTQEAHIGNAEQGLKLYQAAIELAKTGPGLNVAVAQLSKIRNETDYTSWIRSLEGTFPFLQGVDWTTREGWVTRDEIQSRAAQMIDPLKEDLDAWRKTANDYTQLHRQGWTVQVVEDTLAKFRSTGLSTHVIDMDQLAKDLQHFAEFYDTYGMEYGVWARMDTITSIMRILLKVSMTGMDIAIRVPQSVLARVGDALTKAEKTTTQPATEPTGVPVPVPVNV